MNVQAPFGFVTGCHAGDKFMVQATLASMRYYCPSVPICLVVDGTFDVSDLEREYGLSILRVPELPSEEMRKLIGGNYRAKLAAMWEGPFEFYVWLDSDAIVWGDFTPQVRTEVDFQIFAKEVGEVSTQNNSDSFKHFFFDPEELFRFDAQFQWRENNYFCAGVYACRRNVIPFDEWIKGEAWNAHVPSGLFKFGDMGLLNYLVHSKTQRGEIRIATADLQDLWVDNGIEEFEQDCRGAGWHFPETIRRPRVAHFCGRKPFLFDRKAYSRPFTIARLEHYRRLQSEFGAWSAVAKDDTQILYSKIKHRLS